MPPTGSIGGTVDLTTKRATDEPLTRLTTTYMSDSQFGGHLDVGRRFGSDKNSVCEQMRYIGMALDQ